jgi:hypothetical protein
MKFNALVFGHAALGLALVASGGCHSARYAAHSPCPTCEQNSAPEYSTYGGHDAGPVMPPLPQTPSLQPTPTQPAIPGLIQPLPEPVPPAPDMPTTSRPVSAASAKIRTASWNPINWFN